METQRIGPVRRFLAGNKAKSLLGITLLSALVALSPSWALNTVTIQVDGASITVQTFQSDSRSILEEVGVEVGLHDRVTPGSGVPIDSGDIIRVSRSFPVHLNVGGESTIEYAVGGTVGELLADLDISVGPLDRLKPSPDTLLYPSIDIQLTRVTEEFVVVEEPIPYKERRWADPEYEKGNIRLIRSGKDGVKQVTYRLVYENGRQVEKERIQEQILKKPVDKLIGVGTKIVVRTLSTPNGPVRYTDVKEMTATAYYPGPESTGKWADGYTATGLRAGHGIVAVDPKVIPLGTRVYIPGYGEAIAADVGGAIKGDRIDLCFDTYQEAIHYGRRKVKVYILE